MEATDFNIDINIIYNFFKPIIMDTLSILAAVIILLVFFVGFILPRFLRSDKNIFLRMKNSLFGEFEYHQKDKDAL